MSDLLNHISEDALADYDHLREDCGLLENLNLSVFKMFGDDRKGWLQGQATNDVRSLDLGASSSFCLCSATGQIQVVADVWSQQGFFALSCEKSVSGALVDRVSQMVILENVELQDVGKEYRVFSVQGPNASRRLEEHLELPKLDAGVTAIDQTQVLVFRANRSGVGGWDIWVPAAKRKPIEILRKAFRSIGAEAYEAVRLEAGIPLFGRDYTAKTLPPELGPAFTAKHVSYSKGCYTGQEVLMRIHTRGHTNKTWVGLIAEGKLTAGATVVHAIRKEVGEVTSAAFSPDFGYIGAAMIRNEVAEKGERVEVIVDGARVSAEVRQAPILSYH